MAIGWCLCVIIVFTLGQCHVMLQDTHRIAGGGIPLPITRAPFMAFYTNQWGRFQCGASIVHERFLLSAAHCYDNEMKFYATVGSDKFQSGGRHYVVDHVFLHPRYGKPGTAYLEYDVSLMRLRRKIRFGPGVQKIPMAPRNMVIKPGNDLVVMGFGDEYYKQHKTPGELLYAMVPYVKLSECNKAIWSNNKHTVTDKMICAGGKGLDACQGDSGGPLVYQGILVGVVSYGIECGTHIPGVYTRVSEMRGFIDYTIRRHSNYNKHRFRSLG